MVDRSLSRPRFCSPSEIDGGATFCWEGEAIDLVRCRMDEVVFFLLWLVFLPLIVGDGGMVGWILFLQNISGKALFSICSVRMAWVHLACGWDSSRWVISSEKVLLAFLCELVLCAGASGTGGFTSMAEEGGGGGKSKGPTADGHVSRTSCSLPMLGVHPLICIGEFGGLKLLCAGWISQIWHQCLIQRWKTNSRVLDVICVLLCYSRVLL